MKQNKNIYFFSTFFFTSLLFSQSHNITSEFNKNELSVHIDFFGSDSLKGRGTGTEGESIAAEYIRKKLDDSGIKPFRGKEFFQPIPLIGSYPLESSKLILYSDNQQIHFALTEDYLLYNSGEETFIPLPLQLVFAGYGIVAPEFDYNDYQSIDTEGKIVVMLSGEPLSDDKNYFNGENETIYSQAEVKQRLAIARGASGTILIPVNENESWNYYKNLFAFENVSLPYAPSSNLNILFNPSSAEKLFTKSGYSLNDIIQMHIKGEIRSFFLNNRLSFSGEFKSREFISKNILGMIEGNDPELKDSYLIISAHYDHLGIGPEVNGDSIYNGVFDNAVGTASVIELARLLKKNENELKRSVIFLFLTGEEKGLIGSKYYCDHPFVPLYKTIANINVDGAAVFDEFRSIVGIGSEFSTLNYFFSETAAGLNLSVSDIPSQFKQPEAFYKSDQVSFAMAGIPSILTMDGVDYKNITKEEGLEKFYNYSRNIYHTPFDDLSQEINYDALLQHINFLYFFSKNLLTSFDAPEWNNNSPFLNARLISIAEKK